VEGMKSTQSAATGGLGAFKPVAMVGGVQAIAIQFNPEEC